MYHRTKGESKTESSTEAWHISEHASPPAKTNTWHIYNTQCVLVITRWLWVMDVIIKKKKDNQSCKILRVRTGKKR